MEAPIDRCDAQTTLDVLSPREACACLWATEADGTPDDTVRLHALETLYRDINHALHGPAQDACMDGAAGMDDRSAWRDWHTHLEDQLAPRIYLALARRLAPDAYLAAPEAPPGPRDPPVVFQLSGYCADLQDRLLLQHNYPVRRTLLDYKYSQCQHDADPSSCMRDVAAERQELDDAKLEADAVVSRCMDDQAAAWFSGRAEIALAVTEATAASLPSLKQENSQLWAGALIQTIRSAQTIFDVSQIWLDTFEAEVKKGKGSSSWGPEERSQLDLTRQILRELHSAALSGRRYDASLEPDLSAQAQLLVCTDSRRLRQPEQWYAELACSGLGGLLATDATTLPACPSPSELGDLSRCEEHGLPRDLGDPQCAALMAMPVGCDQAQLLMLREELRDLLFEEPFDSTSDVGVPKGVAARELQAEQLRVVLACGGPVAPSSMKMATCLAYRQSYAASMAGITSHEAAVGDSRVVPYEVQKLFESEVQGPGDAIEVNPLDHVHALIDQSGVLHAIDQARPPAAPSLPPSQQLILRSQLDQVRIRSAELLMRPLQLPPLKDSPALWACQDPALRAWKIAECSALVAQALSWWDQVAAVCLLSDDERGNRTQAEALKGASEGGDLGALMAWVQGEIKDQDAVSCDLENQLNQGLAKAADSLSVEADKKAIPASTTDLQQAERDREALPPWWSRAKSAYPEFALEALPNLKSVWKDPTATGGGQ